MICYSADPKYGGNIVYFYCVAVLMAGACFGTILLVGILTWNNINSIKNIASDRNRRAHKMLLMSWLAQLFTLIVFVVVPVIFGFSVMYLNAKYVNYVIVLSINMCALHSSADCLALLIVVRPYRAFIMRKVLRTVKPEQTSWARERERTKSITVIKSIAF